MATENIIMDEVKRGGDRQELHERIRQHSMAAAAVVKEQGMANDLIDRIASDPMFSMTKEEIEEVLIPENFTGRAENQVEEFIKNYVDPVLEGADTNVSVEIKV